MAHIEGYIHFLEIEDMSRNTISSYTNTIQSFSGWVEKEFGIKRIEIISSREIKNYREYLLKKYLPQTVNQKLSAIKTFYRYLEEQEIIDDSPADKIKFQKVDGYLKAQYLTRAEELTIMAQAQKLGLREECIVMTLLKSGIRVSEASKLLIKDISLDDDNPTLLIRDTKNNKSRYIPLSTDLIEIIKKWLEVRNNSKKIIHERSPYLFVSQRSKRLSERGIQLILKKIGEAVDIKLYPIRFRATFSNNLLQTTNIPINILATLMGHSNVSTTQRYATPNMMDKRKYIEQLSEI